MIVKKILKFKEKRKTETQRKKEREEKGRYINTSSFTGIAVELSQSPIL